MYLTDPTLYGATLPQRELPVTAPYINPFYAQNLPMQAMPWQGVPWQSAQRFVPPIFQGLQPNIQQFYGQQPNIPQLYGQQPVVPQLYGQQPSMPQFYGQQPSMPQLFGHMPFMMNPYMSAFTQPYGYGFQKPFQF